MINLEYHYLVIFTILSLTSVGLVLFLLGILLNSTSSRKIGTLFLFLSGLISPVSSFAVGQVRLNEVYTKDLSALGNIQLIKLQETFFQHTVLSHQGASINIILGCIAFFALWIRAKHVGLSILLCVFSLLSITFQYITFESLQELSKYSA